MPPINRRKFLELSLLGSVAASRVAQRGVAAPAEDPAFPEPCPPEAWHKYGVILQPSEPWEGNDIQNFTTSAEPLANGVWRLWYSVSDPAKGYGLAYAEGIPGEPMRKTQALVSPGEPPDAPFAIGNLPAKWNPVQGVHLRLKNGKHRLYFWAHGPQICRYLAAESDDGKRYRVLDPLRPVLYHPNDRAAHGVPSPDGFTFVQEKSRGRPENEPLALSRLISNDATNTYQLPDGSFEMYSVGLVRVPPGDPAYVAEDNAPGCLRVIDRYTSGDGLHLETRSRIIQKDSTDPADQQFYYLAATHTEKGIIGLVGHYRCRAQTMDLEWCFSRTGVNWQRPRRQAWLRRGEPPAADCYGIYAGHSLVRHAGKWHLFYTGTNSSHNGKKSHGKPHQVILYATTDSIWT